MEYPSLRGGNNTQSWYFTDLEDTRFNIIPLDISATVVDPNNANRIITGGGIEKYRGDQTTTFEILTTSGYNPSKMIMNHVQNRAQKFGMLPTDWTNVEITCYIEMMQTTPDSEISFFARSGKHEMGRPCEGTFYRVTIKANGHIRCDMKHWHPGGYEVLDNATGHVGDLEMMRFGFKFVVFNNPDSSDSVIIKSFMDMHADDNWNQVCYVIDTGDTSDRFKLCGDENTKVISWGGPIVGLEIRNFPEHSVAIDKLSVREIDVVRPKMSMLPQPAVFDPEAVSPPVAPPSDGYRVGLDDDDWDDDTYYEVPSWMDPGDNTPPP
jgi:hypothetical protein